MFGGAWMSQRAEARPLVGVSRGWEWVQVDHNSNHRVDISGLFLHWGWVKADMFQVSNQEHVTSQSSLSPTLRSVFLDSQVVGATISFSPVMELGYGWEVYSGPGIGLVLDKQRIVVEDVTSTRSGLEININIHTGVRWEITDKVVVGVEYRLNNWEVDTNRELSDYEVNQQRADYLLTLGWSI